MPPSRRVKATMTSPGRVLASVFMLAAVACGGTAEPRAPSNQGGGDGPMKPMASARQVSRTASGGVIELDGDLTVARIGAQAMMRGHCAGDFQVTQEGGDVTQDADGARQRAATGTAWRVHYTCAPP